MNKGNTTHTHRGIALSYPQEENPVIYKTWMNLKNTMLSEINLV